MTRTGRNQGAYHGDRIDIGAVIREIAVSAHAAGWTLNHLEAAPGIRLPVLHRPPVLPAAWHPRVYVSAGIHGDEPAGPLALAELIRLNALPRHAWLWCCPCLNPTGFPLNTREAASGLDLNRDYRHLRSPEVRSHVAWLRSLPPFDLALCLHEDWEAHGFYIYELNPEHRPSLAAHVLDAVRTVCPIDPSPVIDGREARDGLIRPHIDPAQRPDWPEAFFLIQSKTRINYTLEAPSDFHLPLRVAALAHGVRAAVLALPRTAPVH